MSNNADQADERQSTETHRLMLNASQAMTEGKPRPLSLLIPIKRARNSERAVMYAIRRRAEGHAIAVCLLHVEEPPARWQTMIGRTRTDKKRHQRTNQVFSVAVRMMRGLDIEFAAYVKSGPIIFTILDAAEELACDEIVVPAPGNFFLRLLSRQVVTILTARQRCARLLPVGKHGLPMS